MAPPKHKTTWPLANRVDRLAERVLAGEVVFFIGAGFSLDSEGNSTHRLVGKLLVRFLAMTRHLHHAEQETATYLLNGLKTTFYLDGDTKTPTKLVTWKNLDRLAKDYYQFNDWICSAFTLLTEKLLESISAQELKAYLTEKKKNPEHVHATVKAINKLENYCYALLETLDVPIDPIALEDLLAVQDPVDRGKMLFLDTMGFSNEKVMGGKKSMDSEANFDDVEASYRGLLLPRHRVLARLAREGFCPMLLTTNYDLLLEGGYRLAGFLPDKPRQSKTNGSRPKSAPPSNYQYFARIASANEFFNHGEGYRSALIVKIHGCAETYRKKKEDQREHPDSSAVHDYLPAMVFTYREIQNWRADAWSRDLVRTLLRTHTMVFCGYSGLDPVLHDTFRTVYEEMAAQWTGQTRTENSASEDPTRDAPTFYMDIAEKRDFYSLEILRAASQTVGVTTPELTAHENLLEFYLSKDHFPRLDELFRWLYHVVIRKRQTQMLQTALPGIARISLGHPGPEREIDAICNHFDVLCEEEQKTAEAWNNTAEGRPQFERLVGWTDRFHAGLMRAFTLGATVMRATGPSGIPMHVMRSRPWYYPLNDHPDWAAWAVVVELALRRMVAAWRGCLESWTKDADWVRVARGPHPALLFTSEKEHVTPIRLAIRLAGYEQPILSSENHGVIRQESVWVLHPNRLPWRYSTRQEQLHEKENGRYQEEIWQSAYGETPPADVLWRWASWTDQQIENDESLLYTLKTYLGVRYETSDVS